MTQYVEHQIELHQIELRHVERCHIELNHSELHHALHSKCAQSTRAVLQGLPALVQDRALRRAQWHQCRFPL